MVFPFCLLVWCWGIGAAACAVRARTGNGGVTERAGEMAGGPLWAGDSIAAWSAQAPVRAPPRGATTVVTTAGTSGDIAGRVVGFCFIGSIIGHLLRGEKCSVHGAVHRDQASFRGTAAS